MIILKSLSQVLVLICVQRIPATVNGNIFRECGIVTVETKNPYVIQYCEENNIQCIRIV